MNDKAKIVLWLGLFMILFQIVKDWPAIKAVLFSGSGLNSGSGLPVIVTPGGVPTVPGEVPPAESPPADVPPIEGPKVVPGEVLPPDIPAILASVTRTG